MNVLSLQIFIKVGLKVPRHLKKYVQVILMCIPSKPLV